MINTIKGHLHHISVHFVVANYAVSLLFAVLYLFTGNSGYDVASYYTLGVALVVTPLGFVSGVRVWRVKYKGHWGKIFKTKLLGGLLLTLLGLTAYTNRLMFPDLLDAGDALTAYYLILLTLATAIVFVLGYYGGRLTIK